MNDMKQKELSLIPKTEQYMEYMLNLIVKLPRVEKFSIGNEYKISMYKMMEKVLYLNKNIYKGKNLEILNEIDVIISINFVKKLVSHFDTFTKSSFDVSCIKFNTFFETFIFVILIFPIAS